MNILIRTEILKLTTVRGPWLLLVAGQFLIILGASGLLARTDDPASAVGAVAHVGLVSLLSLVLGIMGIAGEYRHRTITDTYLGTPRRGRVVLAKLGVYAAAGLGFGAAGVVTAVATTAIWLAAKGLSMDWSDADLWRTIGGGIAWNALFAAIGVGVGALIRNLAAAVAAALAWLALVEGLLGQLLGADLSRWLPFSVGATLGRVGTDGGMSQYGAGAVLLAYAAVLAAAAIVLTTPRDIT